MIRAIFYRTENGTLCGYEISGHAGHATKGRFSLVCCAVSTIAITGANALEVITGVEPDVTQEDGYLRCFPKGLTAEQAVEASIILQTVEVGITSLVEQYPHFISYLNEIKTGGIR